METCVFCNSADNLNTGFDITIEDGSKIHVKICDTHSEDATVKSARAAYLSKQDEISKVMAQAKALGLTLSATPSGLTIAQSTRPAEQPKGPRVQMVKPDEQSSTAELDENDPDVVSTESLHNRGMRSVGGQTNHGAVESHHSFDPNTLQEKLDPSMLKGKARMEIVEGREGQPLMLPRKRVDKTGTTTLSIKKIEDDGKLQKRFKSMAKESMRDGGSPPDFINAGYKDSTRTCTICRGDCVVNGQDCPKCQGSGIISVF